MISSTAPKRHRLEWSDEIILLTSLYKVRVTVKIKVKLSLGFNWAPRHEGVSREWRYSSTHSLTSALDGGEWSASRPRSLYPQGKSPGTHRIAGWVDTVVKRKISKPLPGFEPPIIQPLAQRYTTELTRLLIWVLTPQNHDTQFFVRTIDSELYKNRIRKRRRFSLTYALTKFY
jgi:hypothetical protein